MRSAGVVASMLELPTRQRKLNDRIDHTDSRPHQRGCGCAISKEEQI
jgi:hypothetical protein